MSNYALQIAAALAFHLPGARLEVQGNGGDPCLVGSLTDPRCMLHPAEFRDLVIAGSLTSSTALTMNGHELGKSPNLSLTSTMMGVTDLGSGLFRVCAEGATSYTFATVLSPKIVDRVLSNIETDVTAPPECSTSTLSGDEQISVSLIQDDALGVTTVVMCCDTTDWMGERLAHAAVTACVVAEMEQDMNGDNDNTSGESDSILNN